MAFAFVGAVQFIRGRGRWGLRQVGGAGDERSSNCSADGRRNRSGSAADRHTWMAPLVDQGDAVFGEGLLQELTHTRHVHGRVVGHANAEAVSPEGAHQTEVFAVFQAEILDDLHDQCLLGRVELIALGEYSLLIAGVGREVENDFDSETVGEAEDHVAGEQVGGRDAGGVRGRRVGDDGRGVGTHGLTLVTLRMNCMFPGWEYAHIINSFWLFCKNSSRHVSSFTNSYASLIHPMDVLICFA